MAQLELGDVARDALAATMARLLDGAVVTLFERNETMVKPEVIAVLRLGTPAFHPVEDGAIRSRDVKATFALQDGKIGWAVFANPVRANEVIFECDAGVAEGCTLLLNRARVQRGAPVTIKSLTITMARSRE